MFHYYYVTFIMYQHLFEYKTYVYFDYLHFYFDFT